MARYPLSLPEQLKDQAEQIAKSQGVSLNQFILWAVAEKVGAFQPGLNDPDFPGIEYRRGAAGAPPQYCVAHESAFRPWRPATSRGRCHAPRSPKSTP